MENNGWIKVHRKIMDNCIYKDSELLHLLIHCLIKSNHKGKTIIFNNQEITVNRGQFISGRRELSMKTGIKQSSLYRKLKLLEKLKILNIESNNKFSIITVINYNTYQDSIIKTEQQSGQQVNNKRTTNEQQMDTNKKDKNEKNDNNEKKREGGVLPVLENSGVDFNSILNQWNLFSSENNLQSIIKLSEKRKANVLCRVKESEFDLNLIFEKITESDFLRGNNERGWRVDFDFIFGSKNNYLKILENKYKNTNGTYKQQRRNTLQDF